MVLRGEHVVLRPLEPRDTARLRELRADPEVLAWWGPAEDGFPEHDAPELQRLTVLVDDRIAGLLQFEEEDDPMYKQAWMDIYLAPAVRGRGLGVEAVRLLLEHLRQDLGHHRVLIDPAAANTAAIRAYEKAGFRPVGTMRFAERGPLDGVWRDSLLMEHVTDPNA